MNIKNSFKSPLSKAKASGAAGTGTATWWSQRVSAVALIPLSILFAFYMLKIVEYRDIDLAIAMLASPFISLFLALFVGTGLYHGNIGMKEIIEDYVHCNFFKYSLIIFINFLSIITAVAGVCSILVLHLSTFNFN